jgi:CheY-like chemotaxis protein
MYDRQLRRLGYHVAATDSPNEALNILFQHPQKFDALVVDLMMPSMTGIELAERVRQEWPDLPIIMCTAGVQSILDDDVRRTGIQAVVVKPIVKNEIAHAIRKIMDGKIRSESIDGQSTNRTT